MAKKVAIYTGFFLPHLGGVERYVDKLTTELEKIGYQCVIITTQHDESLSTKEHIDGRTIYRLPTYGLFKQRYPIIKKRYSRDLLREIRSENFDYCIINTRFHLTSLLGARLAKKQNIKVSLIEHGTAHFSVDNKILDFFGMIYEHILTSIIKRYVDSYYGVSRNCNKWLEHFGISADGVWYNAINPEDQNVASNIYDETYRKEDVVVSYAGRLIKEKGILNLIEAFESVCGELKSNKLQLVVAGDGPLREGLMLTYKNNKNIHFLGKLDFKEVMSLYKRSDIFVNPSLYPEGLPTAVLEAGLMNSAIIATPRGGTEEVIIDKSHGIIVDGSVDSLKTALIEMIKNTSMRKKSANNVKKRIEKIFSWRSVAHCVDKEIKENS